MNIDEYLKQQNIVAISGIDTRHLTKKLREYGVMNGAVTTEYETIDREKLLEDIRSFVIVDAVKSVSCKTIREEKSEQGLYRVVLMDFGYKRNIVRSLKNRGCDVTIVPSDTPAEEILAMKPDGIRPVQRPRRPGGKCGDYCPDQKAVGCGCADVWHLLGPSADGTGYRR